jgi:hypothetical protein
MPKVSTNKTRAAGRKNQKAPLFSDEAVGKLAQPLFLMLDSFIVY